MGHPNIFRSVAHIVSLSALLLLVAGKSSADTIAVTYSLSGYEGNGATPNVTGVFAKDQTTGGALAGFNIATSMAIYAPSLAFESSGVGVQPVKNAIEKKGTGPSTCLAVQVGAYEDRATAEAMLTKLMPVFPNEMTLTTVVTRDKTRWRLRVLPRSKAEALKVSARLLRERGIKAWIDPVPCAQGFPTHNTGH